MCVCTTCNGLRFDAKKERIIGCENAKCDAKAKRIRFAYTHTAAQDSVPIMVHKERAGRPHAHTKEDDDERHDDHDEMRFDVC